MHHLRRFFLSKNPIIQLEYPFHAAVTEIHGFAIHHWATTDYAVYPGLPARSNRLIGNASVTERPM